MGKFAVCTSYFALASCPELFIVINLSILVSKTEPLLTDDANRYFIDIILFDQNCNFIDIILFDQNCTYKNIQYSSLYPSSIEESILACKFLIA
jgi:hypothetical protein